MGLQCGLDSIATRFSVLIYYQTIRQTAETDGKIDRIFRRRVVTAKTALFNECAYYTL